MENKGLNSASKAYYEKQNIYEIFSRAEDFDKNIENILADKICADRLLDAGCGSGKWLPLLEKLSKEYIGIDLSKEQVKEAEKKKKKTTSILQVGNLNQLPFLDNFFDVVVSAWVLGTITSEEKRKNVVEELKRVLKPNGTIYLVENDSIGEFEELRGHIKRTEDYNNWLIGEGFKIVKKIETNFEFLNLEEARNVFTEIYGKDIGNKIRSKRLNHHILIFEYKLTQ